MNLTERMIVAVGVIQLLGLYVLSYIFKQTHGIYLWPFVLPF